MPIKAGMEFDAVIASTPARTSASATATMSVTCGVILIATGVSGAPSLTQPATRSVVSTDWATIFPASSPMLPWGQENEHSIRSAPTSARRRARVRQSSSREPIIDAMTIFLGKRRFRWRTRFTISST